MNTITRFVGAIIMGCFRILEKLIFLISILLTMALYIGFFLLIIYMIAGAIGAGFTQGAEFSW